jgi:hypothetical protein
MKNLLRVFAHLLFACGTFVFYALPSNKYSWMEDIDPSISAKSIEDPSSDNRVIFTFLLLIIIVLIQLVLAVKSQSRKEKVLSIVFIVVALVGWSYKFWL